MEMDHDACYRVFLARDPRFDGRVFVGVRTTRIYCRPICPARTPKRANVSFYVSAAAAQQAGFRPCLRCRPELSPELAGRIGTSSLVSQALRLIESGALGEGDVGSLAKRLRVTPRHLRRVFAERLGVSPKALIHARRIHLAQQLICDTQMPMIDVALASGFGSVRRFNEAFKALFGRPPATLRKRRSDNSGPHSAKTITVRLPYSPPYDWAQLLSFLARHAVPGVEVIRGDTYIRSISLGEAHGSIRIAPRTGSQLSATILFPKLNALPAIIDRIRSMLDLALDPHPINLHLSTDPLLAPLIAARPGLRIAGYWQGFEVAVRAMLGQALPLEMAMQLAGELAAHHGAPLMAEFASLDEDVMRTFPSPEALVDANLTPLAMPGALAKSLRSLARTVVANPEWFNGRATVEETVVGLRSVLGIGEVMAQYVAMRELRDSDAFPATDVVLIKAAQDAGRGSSAKSLLDRAERWRPWRAYAAEHLSASLSPHTSGDLSPATGVPL
jgi:AraC family transcriptional regulator of adaptative response / DNA-3-methyladenine glycosylase II